MNKRILGIDVARSLAIIGMVIVNFKTTLGGEGTIWLKTMVGFLDGKAAATFVVLAGVGISLMAKSAIQQQDKLKIKKIKLNLLKRALFLWLFGLVFYLLWPADILHFYGIYVLIAAFMLSSSNRWIWTTLVLLILGYPFSLIFFNYENGWDFDSLVYLDFWTISGFFRNLFFNGFHPVFPWVSFLLLGLYFGRQDLNNTKFLQKAFVWSSLIFLLTQVLSYFTIESLSADPANSPEEIAQIFGTAPMPPLPFYMISGCSVAIITICCCIFAAKQFEETQIVRILAHTGQLALSFYVAHVILGIVLILIIFPQEIGTYSLAFSVATALIFSTACLIFAAFWRSRYPIGPLEWAMRKLTS